jgi:amino acid adenylation domain-containing protein
MADQLQRMTSFSADQVRLLAARLKEKDRAGAPPVVRRPRPEGPLPLSFPQERLWFLDCIEPGTAAYNMPTALRLSGPLDAGALRRTLAEVVRRHEALRTTFAASGGQPFQVIAPPAGFPLPQVDLAALPAPAREGELTRLLAAEARRPFDLERGPLLRAALLRLSAADHALALTAHHIVADGWSVEVLMREMGLLYEAFAAGRPSPLPELPVQYADWALWQREHLRGETLAAHLAFWRERLGGVPPLELPADRPRPPVQTFRGAEESVVLPAELAGRLAALARREGATLFMALLAAFQGILCRLSAQTDFAVGSPMANRGRREIDGLIGFFANTLALRTDLSGDPSFRELLGRVRAVTLEALAHEDLPFEKLVAELQPERDRSRPPLVQVLYGLQSRPALRMGGLGIEILDAGTGTARVDLTLVWRQEEGMLRGTLEHNTDLFGHAAARRFLERQTALLQAALADPERRLGDLPLLDAAERTELLTARSGSRTPYPAETAVPELFATQVRRAPTAPAVEFGDIHWTYAELAEQAERLAAHLRRLGVTPGDRVGLALERSAGLVAGMLGALMAGAAYVPLDPAYPPERLAWMSEDAGLAAVVTPAELEASAAERGGAPPVRVPAGSPAYVLYTSGSTGQPKGVVVPHRAIARLVLGTDSVRLDPSDRVGQVANASFDAATFEIWGPLLTGGCVVGLGREVTLSPDLFARQLAERRITALFLTSALFNQIARQAPGAFRGLRHLLFGGETADPGPVRAVLAGGPGRLLHVYGPTESTTFATWHLVAEVAAGAATVPIGRALANTCTYVADPSLRLAPEGIPGELLLGGDGLALGYLRRPDLTAARFVPHPWSDRPGERLYRTGDLVRWRDGALEFLGRIDRQVKIRGFRIEPAEVEAALLEHPAVAACAVVPRQDAPGDRRLAAYLVLVAAAPTPGAGPAELRAFLAARLPAHLVPAAFVTLPALPLTPNGKVDRRALLRLPPPAGEALAGAAAQAAPRTLVELKIAEAWAGLLGLERIGVHDDFFALGGHSLLAIQALSRLRDLFGVEVPVRTLFEEPTVAGIAAHVEAALRTEATAGAPPLEPVPRGGPLPLSYAQARLWFLEQLEPGSAFYNIPAAGRLAGPLRAGVLRACLAEVARRHEALRTTFGDRDGQPFQEIGEPAEPAMPLVDLAGLPPRQREPELRRLAGEETRRPFALECGPLFRAPLFRLAATDHAIVATMHHIVSDGWSMTVFLREMAALYDAFSAGRPSPLPAPRLQHADYAVWQRRWLQGEVLESRLAWWRERLAGVPGLALPTDRPRPAVETFRGRQRTVALSPELTAGVQDLARRQGATLFMVLLAAFQALLRRWTGQTDLAVGSPIANRNRSETEGAIGFFANTLVLRTDLAGDPSFREILGRVREVTLGAYAHEDVPFEKVVEAVQPERDMSRNPLFQVMLVLQNQPWPEMRMGEATLSYLPVDSGTAKFDLTLFWREDQGALAGALEHNTDLFDDSTARRFYGHYETLLRGAVADPERRSGELALLGEAERHQLLREWNGSWEEHWAGRCVHHGVEAQMDRTPGASARVAVTDGERSLTYAELDARANRLARGLRRRGVGPEALVGICVERSLEMVVAALAVAKAGGALVALDPAYPRERLATIIDDAGLAVLLTQASLLERFPQHAQIALLYERGADLFPDESAERLESGVDPDNPVYAIYTSGSTGQPKGILVTHRAFSNLLAWQLCDRSGARGLAPGARTVALSTFGFCVSFQEMFTSWCAGGTLVVADEMTRRDLAGLGTFLEEHGIERLYLPFAALKGLAEAAATEDRLPSRLAEVITAGEQLQVTPAVRALFERLPECALSNQYGASETHVISALTLAGPPAGWPAIPPVGRPVANVRIHLLDGALAPVPIGVAGELYAGGACPPRCYLNDPVLTAQKLVPDPYSPVPGARLYRTGDSARYLADGRIEYHGRIDTQVKIRGFRVELGEIDTVLARHPAVRDAAVVAKPGGADGQRLVAYVVPAAPGAVAPDELRSHLRQKLPEHMVPVAFVEMPALPVNANGKLDQAALPEPDLQAERREYVAPRTPIEELVAGVWAEVLEVERVGVHDNFFAIGGHSLLATRVISHLRHALGIELRLRTLFEAPTVAELTVAIAERLLELAGEDIADEVLAEHAPAREVGVV